MKKLFFAVIAATTIFATIFSSCSKDTEPVINNQTDDGPVVTITLAAEPSSRAFFDNTIIAEDHEKTIFSLYAYVFDASGNAVAKRAFTQPEILSGSARFNLPHSVANTYCTFYVVANTDYGNINNITELDNALETIVLDDHNSANIEDVINNSKRSEGFVMTGKAVSHIAPPGLPTNFWITIKRVVSKVAVQAHAATDFSARHGGGSVFITSAQISKANAQSYSFSNDAGPIASTSLYSLTQSTQIKADVEFNNLFYIYESGPASISDRVTLVLNGYFDADGNPLTTHDRSSVSYTVPLSGTVGNSGEIRRNGYYRIDATIEGLSDDAVRANFIVAEWEVLHTQTIDLGR